MKNNYFVQTDNQQQPIKKEENKIKQPATAPPKRARPRTASQISEAILC